MKRLVLAATASLLFAVSAQAHGPTPQRASASVHIEADPDAVWEIIRDPGRLPAWHPEVASVEMDGEGRGARRLVHFASGGSVTDGIDDVNETDRTIRWRLSRENTEAFPASYYTNDMSVAPEGNGSGVTWKASFFRADTTNEPDERFSDAAATAAMETYIATGLNGLKRVLEGQD
ncbi:MxaD protein [Rhodovulum sulfidophilum]|uniref:SRPBCC family protein n=1 Tax=Rhodovulum visakhapatnamense TaxID=364297 RepID=A0ABS1RDY0_9RHOB|nr:SRPBCC family protein [Rhodovulum visakhapatnamense]MBL3569754.1 SRPBCC family protein [Rhodovulum visakhapatnamense]MBL3577836.1 SRPBCC family protein [Rhodovulum visakhapatnamense]OLS42334.1 MxaD protein [Rhodovulum sulfidophilum]